MSEETDVKVTDRRMFTPEGELREEYRFLEDAPPPSPASREAEPRPQGASPGPAAGEAAPAGAAGGLGAAGKTPPGAGEPGTGAGGGTAPPLEIPSSSPGLGTAGFMDLLSTLAEPIALYLGDAQLPDGRSVEDLEAARFHLDLLDVLRRVSAGNLSAQESGVLEDLLYRLRLRYVEKRG